MKKIIVALAFFTFANSANSADYQTFDLSYNKVMAKSLTDGQGSTYYSDPDDNSFGAGWAWGHNLQNDVRTETEFKYNTDADLNIFAGGTLEVSSISLMQSIYKDIPTGSGNFIIGAGAGIARTMVDTNYSLSGVTFNGSKDNDELVYHLSVGFAPSNNVEILLRHTDYGNVAGGSGTASDSSTYYADKFDHKVQSLTIRYKY